MTPDTADMSLSCHYAAAPHEAQAQAQPATNLPRPAPTSRCCLYPPKQEADEDGSGELDLDEFYEKLGPYLGQSLSQAEVGAGRRRRACCSGVHCAGQAMPACGCIWVQYMATG